MSRLFDGSQALYRSSPVTDYPFTIAAKIKHTTSGVTDNIGGIGATGWANRTYMRVTSGDVAGAVGQGGTATDAHVGTTSIGAGWQSVVVVFNSATDRRIYTDGSDEQTDATNIGTVLLNRLAWGSYYYNGGWDTAYFNGYLCELAVWDVALTSGEAASYDADGALASSIQGSNLQSWLRLFESGNLDDEVDAVTWSIQGSEPAYDSDHAAGYTGVDIAGVAATGTASALAGAVVTEGTASISGETATATAAGLIGVLNPGTLTVGVPIRSSWELQPARVYLHDGYGHLLTQLAQVRAVSRAFAISGDTMAQFEVADTDADVGLVQPDRGLLVRIESVNYPLTWVGYVTGRRRAQAGSYWFTCPARSIDGLLEERFLPVSSTATVQGDVADIIRSLWLLGNVEATTGIALDAELEGGHTIEPDDALSLSGQDVRSMLVALTRTARVEWWIEHQLDGSRITSTLQMRKHRGQLRSDIELRPGAGGNIADRPEEWVDLVGAPFRQRVITGGSDFASRGTALVQRTSRGGVLEGVELAEIEPIHGVAPDESYGGLNPVTSREAAAVVEYIRGATGASRLAQALAQNAAPVQRGMRVQVAGGEEHHETWQALIPGNIVRVNAGAPVQGTGVHRYARVLGAQPMEFSSGGTDGFCHVPLQLLEEVSDASA